MPASSDRRQLSAYLSDESYEGWRRYADRNRVTVAGLLEAIGRELADPAPTSISMRQIIISAAGIDAARRTRRVE